MNHASKLLGSPRAGGAPPPPLSSILPLRLNPAADAVDLISSRLHLISSQSPLTFLIPSNLLPFLGHSELSSILLRSQSLPIPSLHLLSFLHSRAHLTPSPHHFSLLAHSLTFSRLFSHSLYILRRLILTHPSSDPFSSLLSPVSSGCCNWDSVVFSLLVRAYLRLRFLNQALDAFNRCAAFGFHPDPLTSNLLLNSLAKAGHFDTCWEVYCTMRKLGVSPNVYTFNIMINSLCRADDGLRAMGFLQEMKINGFDPDVVTYNTLINGFCRKGRVEKALALYKLMYRRGIEPDLVSCTILMKGLCEKGSVHYARQLFDKMRLRSLSPDEACYGVLVSGYCREGRMPEAWMLLQAMIGCGYLPNDFLCMEIVKGYANIGKLLPCLNVLAQLRKLGVPVSINFFKHLVGALCDERRPNAARNLVKWMVVDKRRPNADICNVIIKSFCDCASVIDAFSLKDEMVEINIRPNRDTYAILIGCLCKLGNAAEAECLMEEMIACGLIPDAVTCAALVIGYSNKGELSKAESLLKYFALEFGFRENNTFNALINVCAEDGDMVKAFEMRNRLMKLGFLPNQETCKFFINALSKKKAMS
ncbi:Pentatricopeptide repeat-containing protein [Platanthera zijinensis]|uniref:Pentatricopeptide repeat-containing protein n=1 Tax=Platanthera zijinensis TaxID=2320716 RepID=A0AAP0AW91_9ASPA